MQKIDAIDIEDTINSGQVFLWNKIGEQWVGVDGQDILVLKQSPSSARSSSGETDNFLRTDDDLDTILSSISKDRIVKSAVKQSPGLRLVRQDPFQCYISFICSSNSSIQNIKLMLENLCKKFGAKQEFEGHTLHTFPKADILAGATMKDLIGCKLGFRAKYVKAAAQAVNSGKIDFEWLKKTDYHTALESLKKILGIGNKVADCIALFSLDKMEAFPIDRWTQRILLKYYKKFFDDMTEKPVTGKRYEKIHEEIVKHFGPYAGYSQQFLFKMERDLNKKNWL
ncbi:DNA-3-methyladenine glycosylase family protein [Candidatus Nitrosotalea okcheonensis]|uniref:DNA-(apurinic or apyrimidinic site) lyase n=1 Tax=Candidatus Nitrosotalea okcheonensis TaxID=1903276 RepID=A0A2H1FHV2_9ARCH|nr:DNA glycosylase [Candidatus Nitrosotalea okcheonensis]SMH72349.1 putative helix-hairpin-helix motif protein [Candidatus Nitrosotalea okcheonensis]